MKNIKLIVFTLVLFHFSGCDNPVEQEAAKLQISFKNDTPYRLEGLLVADRIIGDLPENGTSNYFAFNEFTFDTGLPDEDASAIVNGKVHTNHFRRYWCGTEKITVDSGKYLIEISLADTMLFLSCKNAPRIDYP